MLEELRKQFTSEVRDLITDTEKKLLKLEKNKENKNYIQEIFRSMHTIKGSAGVYGLDRTVDLAHKLENIFSKIRDNKLNITNDIISTALSGIDILMSLVEAESEDEIPKKITENITEKIAQILDKSAKDQIVEDTGREEKFTYYIVFEPNIDIEERGINPETILSDFDEFKYKIITKITDQTRKERNKKETFYEIIVSTKYTKDEIEAIFIFTLDEVKVTKIADFNLFENESFIDFYENAIKILPFSEERLNLISHFANNITENETKKEEQETKEENKLIGLDEFHAILNETKEKDLNYIKVPAKKLDDLLSLVSELIIANSQLSESSSIGDLSKVKRLSENINKTVNNIKENALSLRLIPVKTILPPYYRIVRDLSLKQGKHIEFIADGVETQMDKTIIEKLSVPLMHIIRNSIDHGIEPPQERIEKGKNEFGIIRFIAYYSNTNVIIQIQDDGRGIDPDLIKQTAIEKGFIEPNTKLEKKEIYDLLFLPGFTTSKSVTEISGRGVGMDVIKKEILDLRGDIEIDSEIDLGTSITIKLPLTLSIIETLHLSSAGMHFLIPLSNIDRCLTLKPTEINKHSGQRLIIEDKILPFIDMAEYLNLSNQTNNNKNLVIIKQGHQQYGLLFDKIHGEYQAVVKSLGVFFYNIDFLLGASILGNGSVAYIIDTYKLFKRLQFQKN